jgi:glycosyltransferase involved in cell wall biosynthesis
VSIIIPVGPGHQDVLVDALDSVEAQTYHNWEIIIVNDTGVSLDTTPWPHARLVNTQGSQGAGFARNRGTEAAKAPLIVYLDADDFLQPTFLTKAIETWADHKDHWVYTDTVILHPDGQLENYPVPDWDVRRLWRRGLAGVTSLHTKASWEQVNGFDEQSTREDWDFHLRLAKAGICGIHIPEPLYTYRHSTGKRRDDGTHKREIITIHGTYDQEELVMACRGCGAKKIRRRKMDDIKATSKNWSAKSDTGFVNLEYVGKNKNELMFKGPSKRRYRFGNNEYHRTGLVHPDDVQHLLRLNCFRVATQPVPSGESAPLHADPSPKPSPVREPTRPLTITPKDDTLEAMGLNLNDLNVGARSIQDLKDVDLTKYDLVTAIRLEKAGKNRKSALALLGRAQRRLAREQRKKVLSEPTKETPSDPTENIPDELAEDIPDESIEGIPSDLTEDVPIESVSEIDPIMRSNWTLDKWKSFREQQTR